MVFTNLPKRAHLFTGYVSAISNRTHDPHHKGTRGVVYASKMYLNVAPFIFYNNFSQPKQNQGTYGIKSTLAKAHPPYCNVRHITNVIGQRTFNMGIHLSESHHKAETTTVSHSRLMATLFGYNKGFTLEFVRTRGSVCRDTNIPSAFFQLDSFNKGFGLNSNRFFVVCKKSSIENNTSYYGCFYLGPFDESLSQTLANDLRRTLLSELPGFAITSIEIEGVLHQFSSLKGLKEPVLDFICNLQTIVFKKAHFINQSLVSKKTYTGFLKVRGPRIIKAKDLKLPPGIQCVDPTQYLATLAEDGLLNMKFEIHEGKGYVFQKPHFILSMKPNVTLALSNDDPTGSGASSQNNLSMMATQKESESTKELSSRPISLDAVFMPVTKVNCLIEDNNFATDVNIFRKSTSIMAKELNNSPYSVVETPYKDPIIGETYSVASTGVDTPITYNLTFDSGSFLTGLSVNSPASKKTSLFFKNAILLHQNSVTLSHFSRERHKIFHSASRNPPNTDTQLYSSSSIMRNLIHRLIPVFGVNTLPYISSRHKRKPPHVRAERKPYFITSNTSVNLSAFVPTKTTKLKSSKTHVDYLSNKLKNQKRIFSGEFNSLFLWNQYSYPNIQKEGTYAPQVQRTRATSSDVTAEREPKAISNHFLIFEYSKILQLKPVTKKCNLIVEIWTNGSLHPRQALYNSFIFLSNTFLKLQKIKMLGAIFRSDHTYGHIISPHRFNTDVRRLHLCSENTSLTLRTNVRRLVVARSDTTEGRAYYNLPISHLRSMLSFRAYTSLRKAQIFTVRDLLIKKN